MKLTVLLLAATLGLTNLAQAQTAAGAASADDEGLVQVKVKGLDHVYARPGANLSRYSKVMLDPVEVAFSKSWNPDSAGTYITPQEKQKIKDGLAKVLREELTKALSSPAGYSVVESTGDDVLRIKAEIRDLYINAPDLLRSGMSRSYSLSAGEMRLVAELRDAATGALIARVIDFKKDPDSPWLQLTTSVDNVAAARRAAAGWAQILRRQLDAAHGMKP